MRSLRHATDAQHNRGIAEFTDLAGYCCFIDEIVSRINARNGKCIEAERPFLQFLPDRYAHQRLRGDACIRPSTGGFVLRKVFYTAVPSRLIGHHLRVRLYDDRLELSLGGTVLLTLQRDRSGANGKHGHVSTIGTSSTRCAASRRLLNLVYRDQIFPREAYRLTFDLCEQLSSRAAKTMVELLSFAHERTCEAQLAHALEQYHLADGRLPDLDALRARFAPDPATVPQVHVQLASLSDYEALLDLNVEVTA